MSAYAVLLLAKFPRFDPSWTPEIQAAWWRCWDLFREMRPWARLDCE